MVCSKEREGKYPFDIQHRTIIEYRLESLSDFDKLREQITTRAKALAKKIAEQLTIKGQPVAPTEGLKPAEFSALTLAAHETSMPGVSVVAWRLREKAKRTGLTGLEFGVAIQSLKRKGFMELHHGEDENGEHYETVTVTDSAWTWLGNNHPLFLPSKEKKEQDAPQLTEDDIPF